MSLQARWISTIYGLIFIAGEALSAFCFCVVIETILGKRKPMSEYLTDTQVPVSYTHLDVYKRQLFLFCCTCPGCIFGPGPMY